MSAINSIEDIESVRVHWSESELINNELDSGEDDIEQDVEPDVLDELISRAAKEVGEGYDKTVLTVRLKNGTVWCHNVKFYLHDGDTGLLQLINSR